MWRSLEDGRYRAAALFRWLLPISLLPACGGPSSPGGGAGSGPVASIAIAAPSAAIEVGATLHFVAEARDASGAVIQGVTFSWRSSNRGVATVANGDALGVAPGRTLIAAESGGITSGDALLTVKRPSPSGGASSSELIDAALAARTIDEETALAYRVFAAFGDPRLPASFLGDDGGTFESQIVETLDERFDSLSSGAQEALGPFLLRPSSVGSWADPSAPARSSSHLLGTSLAGRPSCQGTAPGWTTANATSAKVNVWYDSRVAGHKLKAEKISNSIEQAIWPKLIGTLKFKEPAPDSSPVVGCNGGDSRLDVYLVSNVTFRGLTTPIGSLLDGRHCATFIMIRDEAASELPGMVAHEIMHAIQWAYTTKSLQSSYGWLREASANWAIDVVFGKSKPDQVEQEYADCFLTKPELPLEDATKGLCARWRGAERYYGAYLLFQYLANTFGENTAKDAIVSTEAESTGVEAVNAALGGRLKDVWPLFAKRLWNDEPLTRVSPKSAGEA